MKCFDMKPTTCPHCLAQLDAATPAGNGDEGPAPGDISFCIECGKPVKFTDDLYLAAIPDQEWNVLREDPLLAEAEAFFKAHRIEKKRTGYAN